VITTFSVVLKLYVKSSTREVNVVPFGTTIERFAESEDVMTSWIVAEEDLKERGR
jgi:hypothetical protein